MSRFALHKRQSPDATSVQPFGMTWLGPTDEPSNAVSGTPTTSVTTAVTATNTPQASNAAATVSSDTSTSPGSSVTMIIGIVFGVVAAVLLAVMLVLRRRQSRPRKDPLSYSAAIPASSDSPAETASKPATTPSPALSMVHEVDLGHPDDPAVSRSNSDSPRTPSPGQRQTKAQKHLSSAWLDALRQEEVAYNAKNAESHDDFGAALEHHD
ncbi:hypothetical protein RI367_002638 [Sorochytrium milnesiophthora]